MWHLHSSRRLATIDMAENWGAPSPFGEGELGPHLAQCGLGWDLPSCQVVSWSTQPSSHNRHGPKIGGSAPFSGRGELGPHLTQCWFGLGFSLYQVASWSIQSWAENWGLCPLLGRGSWVPIWHSVTWVEAYLPAKWHLDPSSHLATTDIARKLGAPLPSGDGGAGSPSNIMWPGPRPSCVTSFILIHSTIWPQYTNATDRTDGTGQTDW